MKILNDIACNFWNAFKFLNLIQIHSNSIEEKWDANWYIKY